MSVFKLVNETKARGKVKKIFNDIKKTRNIKKFQIFGKQLLTILKHWKEPGII